VALVVDNPQRDLAGLTLVATELARRGVLCYLVPATMRARELWALAPDFVLLYHFRRGFTRLIRQLVDARIGVGALDNEGGVWPEISDYTGSLVDDRMLRADARFMCAWGPRIADALVEEEFFAREQMVVTGAPRFDFYHPMWAPVAAPSDAALGDGRGERRILVNTNYSEGNPRFSSVEVAIEHMVTVFNMPRAEAERVADIHMRAAHASIEMVQKLAADFPDARIVLRPHPFEGTEIYARAIEGIANAELNLEGPVQSQIHRAAAVIQRTSTTAIETAMAGVPALAPLWIPTTAPMPVVESVSVPCESYKELRETVASILAGRYAVPDEVRCNAERVLADWFFRIDGLAHRRVAETILANLEGGRRVDEALCALFLHGLDDATHSPADRVARKVRYRFGLTPEWSFRHFRAVEPLDWAATDQFFDAGAVRDIAGRVLEAAPANGSGAGRLVVEQARDARGGRGGGTHYSHDYNGHAVALHFDE
jgi:surface carbohydrate biosynthesis protein